MNRCLAAAAAALLSAVGGWASPALAIAPHHTLPPDHPALQQALPALRVSADSLEVNASLIPDAQMDLSLRSRVGAFQQRHGNRWEVRWDARGDRAAVVQGEGIALIPGRGNRLDARTLALSGDMHADLPTVAAQALTFLDSVPELLRNEHLELKFDPDRSTGFGPGNERWFIEFQQYHQGIPVDGAFVYARIVHGNVVQFGAERVGDIALSFERASLASAATLFAGAWAKLGFPAGTEVIETLQDGELRIYPMLPAGQAVATAHSGLRGSGYEHVLARRYVFRVDDHATWQVLVDARSGEVIDLRDLTLHVDATVSGGVYPNTNTDPQMMVNFPFTAVTNGTPKITNIDGVYDYTGGTATVTLDGQYFRMADNCGAISLSNNTTGNLNLGTSGGTDCTTPGFGGAGNTHSSRTGFYHLTLINAKARSILPANAWLQTKVTANMNINNQCNATWNGTAVNFYRSGGGCSNTGEIAAVFLHEWGHGMDQNTGGAAGENASGEAVGDTFAFLETRDSCIGPNFIPGQNCHNCTSCTGVRDVRDFGLSGTRVIASPANITAAGGINCGRFSCPYSTPQGFPYRGPMGYQGHCESLIASSANWDLKNALVEEFGESGWQRMDNIWYGSLVPSKSAFQVASGGTCDPSATVNGCGATNWYTVFLAADDDDGNLANGTPNACRIWDAFNAHGIACGARPACTQFATPDFSLASDQPSQQVCAGQAAQFPIAVGSQNEFANPVTLAVAGHPAGSSAAFATNPVVPGNATTLSIGDTADVGAGTWPLLVTGSAAASDGRELALSLRIDTSLGAAPLPQSPSDGSVNAAVAPLLSWQAVAGAASYRVEVATDAAFNSIVAQQAGIIGTSWQAPSLQPDTEYFWRVTASNGCGDSAPSSAFRFTTVALFCRQPGITIPDNNAAGLTDTMVVTKPGQLESLRLRIRADHTYVGDLTFRLSRDGGSEIAAIDRPGFPASSFGCGGDNINVLLDDGAAALVENACSTTPPAISGVLRPNELLGPAFAGLDFAGSWSLRASDGASDDTGTLLEWCLEPTLAPDQYTVGGTVSGLLGSGLSLVLNGGDPLAIAADGTFEFASALNNGSPYNVIVATQPSSPSQVCEVEQGSGTIAGANVTNVSVVCSQPLYAVGGSVAGLMGSGLALSLNGSNSITVDSDGSFGFPELLPDGESFAVDIIAQPSQPEQQCRVLGGSGQINGAHVDSVEVACDPPAFRVGGSVQGLLGSGLQLGLNGGDALDISANGNFQFGDGVPMGESYLVVVLSQPLAPSQTCSVQNGSGEVGNGDIGDIVIDCVTSQFSVGGSIAGLEGSGLALSLNGGPAFGIDADGGFSFPALLDDGSQYEVAILSQPSSPTQQCDVDGASGQVDGADVDAVSVTCTTPTYQVGGEVSGLQGSGLLLSLNGGDPIEIDANGSFAFAEALREGDAYSVTVVAQPQDPEQACSAIDAEGTIQAGNVSSVQVLCFPLGVFSDDFE